jgi:hypothetical protein
MSQSLVGPLRLALRKGLTVALPLAVCALAVALLAPGWLAVAATAPDAADDPLTNRLEILRPPAAAKAARPADNTPAPASTLLETWANTGQDTGIH